MKNLIRQSGFTLLELMVVVALVAILAAVGIPGYRDLIANNALTTSTNNFVAAISYARSEAIKRAAIVSVTAANPSAGNEWGGGWNVVDPNGNIIRVFEPVPRSVVMDDGTGTTTLLFDGRGLLFNAPGNITISICDDRPDERGRQLTISPTGRPLLNRNFNCP